MKKYYDEYGNIIENVIEDHGSFVVKVVAHCQDGTVSTENVWVGGKGKDENSSAHEILDQAASEMSDRAATYDKPEGERSMGATVRAFEAVSGVSMTEEQGWLFMALLKAVRSQQGALRMDSYIDGAAYFALAGEAAARMRSSE